MLHIQRGVYNWGNSNVDLYTHVLIQSILCSELITILYSSRSLDCLQSDSIPRSFAERTSLHALSSSLHNTDRTSIYHTQEISFTENHQLHGNCIFVSISEIHPHSMLRGSKYQGNYLVCLTGSLRLFRPSSVWNDHGFPLFCQRLKRMRTN